MRHGRKFDEDAGLAGERTDLAWNRTGLSLVAIIGSVVRAVLVGSGPLAWLALSTGAVGALLWAGSLRKARQLATTTSTGRHAAEVRALTAVTVGTVLLAAAGALVLFVPLSR